MIQNLDGTSQQLDKTQDNGVCLGTVLRNTNTRNEPAPNKTTAYSSRKQPRKDDFALELF